jgi:hypothetical protein
MANEIRNAKNVIITVDLPNTAVIVFAGTIPAQAAAGQFQTDGNPTAELIDEIFEKTLTAILKAQPTIDLNIKDGKFIERDESFKLTGVDREVAVALASEHPREAVLEMVRSIVTPAAMAPAPKRAAPKRAAPKRTAAKRAAPKRAASKRVATGTTAAAKPKSDPKKRDGRSKKTGKPKKGR